MAIEFSVKNIGNRDSFPTRRIIVVFTKSDDTIISTINDTGNFVDVRVKLSRNYGGIDPQASVSVCNLSDDLIRILTTTQYAPKNSNKVFVYAGYETKGSVTSKIPLLFEGTILWAVPTSGRPDVWFDVVAVEQFYRNTFMIDIPSGYIDLYGYKYGYELIAGVAKNILGYTNVDTSFFESLKDYPGRIKEYEIKDRNYSFYGIFGKLLRQEAFQWGRMSAIQMSNKLILTPCSSDLNFLAKTNKTRVETISAQSNPTMIGIPTPNPNGITLTTLFDTSIILPSKYFRVNSFIFPTFENLTYWVQKVDYDLCLREQNFYNHITGARSY